MRSKALLKISIYIICYSAIRQGMQFDISGLVTILEYNMLVFVIIYSMKWSDVFNNISAILLRSVHCYTPRKQSLGGI